MELGGLLWISVLKLALPPQRHSPDTWLEHQEPFIHTAQNKRERKKERKERKKGKKERKKGRKEERKEGRKDERTKERKKKKK